MKAVLNADHPLTDFHTHLLPNIDDGSKDIEMTRRMLAAAAEQGVTRCVATPHFYADRVSLQHFLQARKAAYASVRECLNEADRTYPEVLLGAEVAYFPGIGDVSGLEELCIEGTGILLLEMPFIPWTSFEIAEIERLSKMYHLLMAHIDRYLAIRENIKWIERLQTLPVDLQINAGSLIHWTSRTRIHKYIRSDYVIGSDMHDTDARPQNLSKAIRRLSKEEFRRISELTISLLGE